MNIVALIPARAGSKRVPGKNFTELGGETLADRALTEASRSRLFSTIVLATDDPTQKILDVLGFRVFLREPVPDTQADIVWIREVLHWLPEKPDAFAILRPTSPFRTAATIRRAFAQFQTCGCDSLRAVEPVRQHPGKMWSLEEGRILPLLGWTRSDGVPWHSCPTQTLPVFYVQNSSLEMGFTTNVTEHGTIHGKTVAPFFTEGLEGFSIDYPEDWERAERLIASSPQAEIVSVPQSQ